MEQWTSMAEFFAQVSSKPIDNKHTKPHMWEHKVIWEAFDSSAVSQLIPLRHLQKSHPHNNQQEHQNKEQHFTVL
jgi:hypothetical protein